MAGCHSYGNWIIFDTVACRARTVTDKPHQTSDGVVGVAFWKCHGIFHVANGVSDKENCGHR